MASDKWLIYCYSIHLNQQSRKTVKVKPVQKQYYSLCNTYVIALVTNE